MRLVRIAVCRAGAGDPRSEIDTEMDSHSRGACSYLCPRSRHREQVDLAPRAQPAGSVLAKAMIPLVCVAFALIVTPHASHAPHVVVARADLKPACTVTMAGKSTWSIGNSRKKAARPKAKKEAPVAKGFGVKTAPAPPKPKPKRAATTSMSPKPAPADPDANDLAAVAAAAGGDTWRSYAEQALAQVEALEEEARAQNCTPEELLAQSSPAE